MRQFWIVALEIGLAPYCLHDLPQAFYLLAPQGLIEDDLIWLVIKNSNQLLVQIMKAKIK